MDRATELAEKIKRKKQERKELEKMNNIKTNCKLIWNNERSYYDGHTKLGKRVVFEGIRYGITEQGRLGAGTLSVQEDGEWRVIFTKGYPSKALEWMENN